MIDELPFSKRKQTGRGIQDITETVDLCSEDELQRDCENWLKAQNIKYVHISQAVYKSKRSRKKYHGVPDFIIIKQNSNHGRIDVDYFGVNCAKKYKHNECLLIELKSLKGRARQGQHNWAQSLNVYLLRSLVDFKKLVEEFLG